MILSYMFTLENLVSLATCSILQHDINLRFAEVLDAEGDRQAGN